MTFTDRGGGGGLSGSFGNGRIKVEASAEEAESSRQAQRAWKMAVLKAESTRFGRTTFRILESGGLAFDHAAIIAAALTALREEAKNYDAIFDFLPETFTLSALQRVQETIMNVSILPANFRRMVSGYVEETDEYVRGEGHRPAKLYRRKK